uniref:Uncharacterized protein n=1 Tax=Panagrolaimus sp. JU765 TaxID=591449 RepID=A0AC34PX19_9BILA
MMKLNILLLVVVCGVILVAGRPKNEIKSTSSPKTVVKRMVTAKVEQESDNSSKKLPEFMEGMEKFDEFLKRLEKEGLGNLTNNGTSDAIFGDILPSGSSVNVTQIINNAVEYFENFMNNTKDGKLTIGNETIDFGSPQLRNASVEKLVEEARELFKNLGSQNGNGTSEGNANGENKGFFQKLLDAIKNLFG